MDQVKRLLWNKSDNTLAQLLRYVVVAGIGLVVDFGGLVYLTQSWHFYYVVAATCSFSIALVINYALSMLWVFRRSKYSWLREFAMFGGIGLVGLGINDLLIWQLTSRFGLFYVWSKALATVVVFIWNFVARKWFFASSNSGLTEPL